MYQTVIDLSQLINNQTTIYPGSIPPSIRQCNTIEEDGFRQKQLNICTHFSTHIDAPAHILPLGKTLDQLPVSTFIGNALKIDVRGHKYISKDILFEYQDEIAKVDFVIFQTGWEDYWFSDKYFEAFPILDAAACAYLVSFDLKGVGFDAISVDSVGDNDLMNHKVILGKEMIIIENLCNLDHITSTIFEFQCFPLYLEDADGSPVRAIARY